MAGVSISVDDGVVRDALSRLEKASARPNAALRALGQHLVTSAQMNIEREAAPDGTPWTPLSRRTASQRVGGKRRGAHPMLRLSGRLYGSVTYAADDESVEWGSNLVYARIHQLGGTIDMPARAGSVSLKTIRARGGGIRTRFARPGRKGVETRPVSIRGYRIRIPARPYLGISAADRQAVPEIVTGFLRAEVGA